MIKTLAIAATLSLFAGSAFAATTFSDTGTTTLGTPAITIKPSKNVSIYYNSAATTGAGYGAYSIGSNHSSGSKTFGSSSGDQKIFMRDGTSAPSIAVPAVGGTADFTSGWTSM